MLAKVANAIRLCGETCLGNALDAQIVDREQAVPLHAVTREPQQRRLGHRSGVENVEIRTAGHDTGNLLNWHFDFAVHLEEINDGFQARRVIKGWMTFYNTRRPHSALERETPDDAYWASLEKQKAA